AAAVRRVRSRLLPRRRARERAPARGSARDLRLQRPRSRLVRRGVRFRFELPAERSAVPRSATARHGGAAAYRACHAFALSVRSSMPSARPVALVAFVTALVACDSNGDGNGTAGKRIVLRTSAVAEVKTRTTFTTGFGWDVTLSKAAVAVAGLYYFDGPPPTA